MVLGGPGASRTDVSASSDATPAAAAAGPPGAAGAGSSSCSSSSCSSSSSSPSRPRLFLYRGNPYLLTPPVLSLFPYPLAGVWDAWGLLVTPLQLLR
ncbi:hypothetical protein HYH02_011867 [Chlamydomonas schloesseri]|uniref:Uncharacterized protein n=1 Tax=Chlamydomonas schloesseri TaxID=2026947 RepID=A0A835T3Z7_9CHLO|nr:hypothetical protein HYH02_011867 [Chlamydomonas schloesseri]|eukprot:KAG2435573.1 hypothetical protein HYH02_011867 [Chlamydomonas schloesseri]